MKETVLISTFGQNVYFRGKEVPLLQWILLLLVWISWISFGHDSVSIMIYVAYCISNRLQLRYVAFCSTEKIIWQIPSGQICNSYTTLLDRLELDFLDWFIWSSVLIISQQLGMYWLCMYWLYGRFFFAILITVSVNVDSGKRKQMLTFWWWSRTLSQSRMFLNDFFAMALINHIGCTGA